MAIRLLSLMLVRTVHRNQKHLRSFSTHVYTWGSGNEGQLGHPSIEKAGIRNAYEELVPKRVEFFDNLPVKKLAFGTSHSLAGKAVLFMSFEIDSN